MSLLKPASLGILDLERGPSPWAPRPGSHMRSDTYNFPVILETVPGAWSEIVIRGEPALEPAFIATAQKLVERGAVAISTNCGFSIRHQAAVAAAVNVPVGTSSLLLLPMLLQQWPAPAKIAVLTFDSKNLGEELLGIDNPAERARVVIGGIEGGELWHNELKRPPERTDVESIGCDVAACVTRLRAAHPEIAAILFECTAFPLVTSAIRRITRLPIYDVVSLCRTMLGAIERVASPDVPLQT